MNKKIPLVNFITVNYNGSAYLKPLFESLQNLDYPKDRIEVTMVDNGSKDDSVEFVKKYFPDVRILINGTNNYCLANNLGIRQAKGKYIALINNDLTLDKLWLKEILKIMEQDEIIGAATGKILFPDGKLQSTGHCEFPNSYWCDRGFKEEDRNQYDALLEIPSISNCATIYRRSCLLDTGPLDEDFNMFLEDVDISIRAKEKGWRLIYVPTGIAHHKFHGSIEDEKANFYLERNRLFLIAKHYPQKLNDALFGKGYFNVSEDNKPDQSMQLNTIIPQLANKLFKHHSKESVLPVLEGLFNNFKKMIDFDKHRLVQRLDYEMNKSVKKDEAIQSLNKNLDLQYINIESLSNEIRQRDQQLQNINSEMESLHKTLDQEVTQREEQLQGMYSVIQEKIKQIESLNINLGKKEGEIQNISSKLKLKEKEIQNISLELTDITSELAEKNSHLLEKENCISYLNRLLCFTRDELLALQASKGYFFCDLIRNWRLKPAEKEFKQNKNFKILLVKPQRVSLESTKKIISEIKHRMPDVKIAVVANLLEEDYMELIRYEGVSLPLFYSPVIKKFTFLETLKLLFKLPLLDFDLALALVAKPYYSGFRRTKLLAALSGAKRREVHFINSEFEIFTPDKRRHGALKNPLKDALLFILNELMLFLTVLGFLIFIVPGIKILKMKHRLNRLFFKKS